MKLKGISAIEKLFGKKKVDEALKDVIIKPQGKPTLVSEDDKRPALGFEDAVKETVKTSESSIIAKYLNDLCGLFSKYYEETNILKEENSDLKNSRLLLLDSVRIVIENGTKILGIKTVDKL